MRTRHKNSPYYFIKKFEDWVGLYKKMALRVQGTQKLKILILNFKII